MSNFHFIRPYYLLLLIPAFFFLFLYFKQGRYGIYSRIFPKHILKNIMIKPKAASVFFNPTNWFFIILILSIISISGPTISKVETPFNQDESRTIIAIYIGESMEANDITPNRLERIKIKLQELFKIRSNGYYSIVVYTSNAYQILPFTKDTQILSNFVKALAADMSPVSGRNESSLSSIIFKSFKEGAKGQNLLLVTDEITIKDSKGLRALLKKYQINLSVYGIGNSSVELENFNFDNTSLKKFSSMLNANYTEFDLGNSDLRDINSSLKEYYPISDDDELPWHDLGYYLLFIILIPFAMSFRKGWIARITIFSGIFILSGNYQEVEASPFLSPFFTGDQQGKIYYQLGRYDKAAKSFKNQYYKGISYYLAQDFKNAQVSLTNIDTPEAKFAHANSLAHLGYYLSAMEEYQELLKEAPEYEKQAKININIMKALVEEVDSLSESQRPEGEELANIKKDKFKVARGSKTSFNESNNENDKTPLDINSWMKKVHAPLEDFLVRKIQVLEARRNEN
ncbi:VWA domain-containing protein [Halobacteriovorax sp. DPLXC-1]|uniref:VWA domain-containing protein n=1 Tax=Halobacteriovorax sp. DPLXC-1 TaxID=3110771 RepID=UPI002FF360E9